MYVMPFKMRHKCILFICIVYFCTGVCNSQRSLSINIVHKAADTHHHHGHGDHGHGDHGHGDHGHGDHGHGDHGHGDHGHGDHGHGDHGHGDHGHGDHGHGAHNNHISSSPHPSQHSNGYFPPSSPVVYKFQGTRPVRGQPLQNRIPPSPTPPPPSRFSVNELNEVITKAKQIVDDRLDRKNVRIFENGAILSGGSSKWSVPASPLPESLILASNISRAALVSEETTRILARIHKLDAQSIAHELPVIRLDRTLMNDNCPVKLDPPCKPHKYRSYNGFCNNVDNPSWGNSLTRYARFLAPAYADGISEPRITSVSGSPLPSARNVSITLHRDDNIPHNHLNVLTTIFGELIAHDVAHTLVATGHQGHHLKCCSVKLADFHPECFPMRVPRDDPVYINKVCLEYARSTPAVRRGCSLGPREQMNQATSFIDGSMIYGPSELHAERLRTFKNGELKSQIQRNGREFLPEDDRGENLCKDKRCFLSGDVRANENAGLTTMHIIWQRQHNRIARQLSRLNKHWNDHLIFEETRRIIGAQLQHITYNELLPNILGTEYMDRYGLTLKSSGYTSSYDTRSDPSTSNEIATAVFGFIFSMMPSTFELYTPDMQKIGDMPMSKTLYNIEDIRNNRMNDFLMGMLVQQSQQNDAFMSSEMTNHVHDNNATDIAALFIQRGRDHGIPSYHQFRKYCAIAPALKSFDDLSNLMTAESISALASVYSNVRDIDLFSGGLAELPLRGAVVGPTFACLLAQQFKRLKNGDRFWYENDTPPSRFTPEQLHSIRETTLSRIICDNADQALHVQPQSMHMPDEFLNAFQDCSRNTKEMDLTPWKSDEAEFAKQNIKTQLDRARRELVDFRNREAQLHRIAAPLSTGSSQAVLSALLSPTREALQISNQSLLLEFASRRVIQSAYANRDMEQSVDNINDIISILPNIDISDILTTNENQCDTHMLPCDHTSKYRTITGWCNNLNNPSYGQSLTVFKRLLPAVYQDGLSELRQTGPSGSVLPNARLVSTSMHYDIPDSHRKYTLMVMQWGQFLDHDVTLTPMVEYPDKSNINCKRCDSQVSVHPECRPIAIPPTDKHFPLTNADGSDNCISFIRSLPGQKTLGVREHLNQATSFVDASGVYGSNSCDMNKLRSFVQGRLNVTLNPSGGKPLLPQTATHKECRAPSRLCFEAGDNRASEQPGLAAIHTIFMREHNRLVDGLLQVNPHWKDEKLFQEGRRILSAVMQHITYNEFLPRILGKAIVDQYDLSLLKSGHYKQYDPTCSPTIATEFSTAAFRFGHTLIAPFFKLLGRGYQDNNAALQLRRGFFNPDVLYTKNGVDLLIRGLVSTSMENFDNSITEEVTNHLFEERRKPFSGMDLIALNIQRARDHGIDGYNAYRSYCNLSYAQSFDDLAPQVPSHLIKRLKSIYRNVDDIDLFTGGLAETPVHGGVVGPTLACIIGEQFKYLKKCDRFWYETDDPVIRFSQAQLSSIREVTLSRIICDNSDNVNTIQRQSFDQIDDFMNPRIPCANLPTLNFELWRDIQTCIVKDQSIPLGQSLHTSPCVSCTCTKEGPLCTSNRIQNCFQFLQHHRLQDIMADDICKVQCSFAVNTLQQLETVRQQRSRNPNAIFAQ